METAKQKPTNCKTLKNLLIMAREYISIEEAIQRGYTHASNDEGKTYPLKSMDSLDTLEYHYVVVDGVIDDDGLMLSF